MDIRIVSKHCTIDQKIKEYTQKKFDKLTPYRDTITSICVTFTQEKLSYHVEAKLETPGSTIIAKADSNTQHSNAVDTLIDRVIRQLHTRKDKLTDHR